MPITFELLWQYKWYICILISVIFVVIYKIVAIKTKSKNEKSQKNGKARKVLFVFLPLALALPIASLCGIIFEMFFRSFVLMISVVFVLVVSSVIFEGVLSKNFMVIKLYLPFLLSSMLVGGLMEPTGYLRGTWGYPGMGIMFMIIFVGYFTFFYVAKKIESAIAISVEGK
jgi:hypothetical protein